ncbi:MAG: hypothetical protein AAFV43_00865 [Planctomycetota bacterium]
MPNRITLYTLKAAHRTLGQSLLRYLSFAEPYVGPGDTRLIDVLEAALADQQRSMDAIVASIASLGGGAPISEFPARHTDVHDLEVGYGLRRAATDERRVAADIEQLRTELAFAPRADALLAKAAREAERRADSILLALESPPAPAKA